MQTSDPPAPVGPAIGLLGGTFNPVHIGHLRGAIECRELLGLDQVVLVPAALPPLKEAPGVSAEHRAAMVARAIEQVPGLGLDTRELSRSGLSYTVDTLAEWRADLGEKASLTFIMGGDALVQLERWHRWHDLLSLANIAVMVRPGTGPALSTVLRDWLAAHEVAPSALHSRAAGAVARVAQHPLAISSTAIRGALADNRDVRFLLPEPVMEYIVDHDLYRC